MCLRSRPLGRASWSRARRVASDSSWCRSFWRETPRCSRSLAREVANLCATRSRSLARSPSVEPSRLVVVVVVALCVAFEEDERHRLVRDAAKAAETLPVDANLDVSVVKLTDKAAVAAACAGASCGVWCVTGFSSDGGCGDGGVLSFALIPRDGVRSGDGSLLLLYFEEIQSLVQARSWAGCCPGSRSRSKSPQTPSTPLRSRPSPARCVRQAAASSPAPRPASRDSAGVRVESRTSLWSLPHFFNVLRRQAADVVRREEGAVPGRGLVPASEASFVFRVQKNCIALLSEDEYERQLGRLRERPRGLFSRLSQR